MNQSFKDRFIRSLAAGAQGVTAWADVLDRINVFPVPDGDTGRNLVLSLHPFRRVDSEEGLARRLLLAARGNSGNIAGRFFSEILTVEGFDQLAAALAQGRDRAYQAVAAPKTGTMLTLFDALVEAVEEHPPGEDFHWAPPVIDRLAEAVTATRDQLPELTAAGVVDAGALGMFIFFDGFFNALYDRKADFRKVAEQLKGALDPAGEWGRDEQGGYCLDVVLQVGADGRSAVGRLYDLGESVVTVSEGDLLKVHLHTADHESARRRLGDVGRIVRFQHDDLTAQTRDFAQAARRQALHLMTDAAGSLDRETARRYGVTLLDSYINLGAESLPETYVDRDRLFSAMREGQKASTSQASDLERRQHYQKALDLNQKVLYLCVGSAFTGNYGAAEAFRAENDPEGRMTVMDTGAASGRLGLIALAAARFNQQAESPRAVIDYARRAAAACDEMVFLNRLKYLAQSGRMPKAGAFFGDVFNVKPVVSPRPEGVVKLGVVRSTDEQIAFALDYLGRALQPDQAVEVMLQYTDNRAFIEDRAAAAVQEKLPRARVTIMPLSLTSATHMGPGSWALAFLPDPG